MTQGGGIMTSVFDHYGPVKVGEMAQRQNGVLVSMVEGKALGFSLFALQERGRMFIEPNVEVYEGQIIGLHSRGNDLVVNPTKGKKLTNMRASGSDDSVRIIPRKQMTLEECMEYIQQDECIEVTPKKIRLRKTILDENERKRASKKDS